MPDFVSENSLDASELEAQLSKAKEANEKHILEEEPERKSLYEQLKESKEQKHLDYQKLLETQNSSYKLDEKSVKFYDELKKNEREKEQKRIRAEAEKLNSYRNLKNTQQKPIPNLLLTASTFSTSEIPKSSITLRKRKAETNMDTIRKPNKIMNKSGKDKPTSPSVAESNDQSTNSTCSEQQVIRCDIATATDSTTSNIIQGLGDYASSDEE